MKHYSICTQHHFDDHKMASLQNPSHQNPTLLYVGKFYLCCLCSDIEENLQLRMQAPLFAFKLLHANHLIKLLNYYIII